MTISNITLINSQNKNTLTADIAFKGEPAQKVYFSIDQKHKYYIYPDASPFLASFLLPCMKKKENILIDGSVSTKLYRSTDKIVSLVTSWKRGFHKIDIKVKAHKNDGSNPKQVGCFFTGGVDSFYTLSKNSDKIGYLILIHGCDIQLNNPDFFQKVYSNTQKIAKELGIKTLVVESNYRNIIEPKLEWEWELGSALASVSLFLRMGFKEVFIPGGMRWDQLCPYGTHPDLDPLWSSEKLKINHDGCEYSRLEKVKHYISKNSLALNYLRVCCYILKDKYNCNECMKCIQTKMELLCSNSLEKAATFDNQINYDLVKKIYYHTKFNFHLFGEDVLKHLQENNKYHELQDALKYSLTHSENPSALRRLVDLIAYLDKKYNQRRLYHTIFSMDKNHDRNFLFKAFSSMGLIK